VTSLILEAPGAVIRAADSARRTISGRVLTYGEYGNTSAGRKRFRAGSVELPSSPTQVLLLRGHTAADGSPVLAGGDGEQAGAAVRLDDNAERLDADFRVTTLPVGDVLLAEADPACPIRGGLSVEVVDVEFDPADPSTVIRARLKAVAAVPFQAYPSSRMTSVAASAHDQGDPVVTAPVPVLSAEPAAAPAAPAIDYTQLAAALAPALAGLTAAAAPAGLPTGALPASPGLAPSAAPAADDADPVHRMATLQAAVFQAKGNASAELRAALADITNSGLDLFQSPAGALGEKLWEGASYTRQFTGLFRQRPLTSWKGTGWQWVNRPKMAAYAGDKAEVPTNTVSVEPKEWEATRIAGAWDIDRKFRDFADAEFWTEFYAAQAESYREVTDAQAAAFIAANALDSTVDANVPAAYAGINVAQADILKAAALGTAILEDTPRVRKGPDYVGMNTADWLTLVEITNLDLPAFLALLKIKPEQFMRSSQFAAGKVTLGVTNAATFRELGGGSPIRVEALDIAHGGIDSAVFGYTAFSLDRPGGIITVPLS
jgi:hypothetical protein